MAEESEKRFHAVMDKLFFAPPPNSKPTRTPSSTRYMVFLYLCFFFSIHCNSPAEILLEESCNSLFWSNYSSNVWIAFYSIQTSDSQPNEGLFQFVRVYPSENRLHFHTIQMLIQLYSVHYIEQRTVICFGGQLPTWTLKSIWILCLPLSMVD